MKKMALLAFAVLVFGSLAFGGNKAITGVVSDSHCGAKHATPGNADCVEHCVSGGATYILVSKGKIYQLDGQNKFLGLAGRSVTVTGTLNGTTITVTGVLVKM